MKNGFSRWVICSLILLLAGFVSPETFAQKSSIKSKSKKKTETLLQFPAFPKGSRWLNGKRPPKDFFADKVTLIYFWDHMSINCIREMKTLKSWADTYRAYRFQILWVHAPEFPSASDAAAVRRAASSFKIKGPVLMDDQFKLWDTLGVKAWPTKLLMNEKGQIVHRQGGEGEYYDMEAKIRSAIKSLDSGSVLPGAVFTENVQAYNPIDCGEMTAETYLGYKKANWWGARMGNREWVTENETRIFRDQGDRSERGFFLQGLWSNRAEFLEHARETKDLSDYAGLLYQAREVYTAAAAPRGSRVYVTRDEKPVPEGYRGQDLLADENGNTYFSPAFPRLYYLIRGEDTDLHELKLRPVSKNVQLYTFSFSNLCLAEFDHP